CRNEPSPLNSPAARLSPCGRKVSARKKRCYATHPGCEVNSSRNLLLAHYTPGIFLQSSISPRNTACARIALYNGQRGGGRPITQKSPASPYVSISACFLAGPQGFFYFRNGRAVVFNQGGHAFRFRFHLQESLFEIQVHRKFMCQLEG